MGSLLIEGTECIHGKIELGGNKNLALPALAAAVLARQGTTVLHNVPDIADVRNMLEILGYLGVDWTFAEGDVSLDATTLDASDIPAELCSRVRTSILFAGPLASRLGRCRLGFPGGDPIGRRRLDTHFYGLERLGVTLASCVNGYELVKGSAPSEVQLFLDEPSVTGTEHIMMTAASIEGETTLLNAACEPHVEQLAALLNSMGADITGAGTNVVVVRGSSRLHGGELTLESDYVEAASYMTLCAATGGDIEIAGKISPHYYWMTRRVFEKFGCQFTVVPGRISMRSPERLAVSPDMNNAIPVISDGPWPQFPSDMMSCFIAMATQAQGTCMFFEKMFESRIFFVDKLIAMGANAIICDTHRVVVSGPARLHGITMYSPDIRAGMAMIVAACCASGQSTIENIEMVLRGYQGLVGKLNGLGVKAALK